MPQSQHPPAIDACDYQTRVTNPHDGVEIAITVMQPALAAGQTAPLILHGHGFGGSRMIDRNEPSLYESLSGGALPSTDAARQAAHAGYFVISFDQRGFGESGGHVHIMDPAIEVRDIQMLLDWAEAEMAHAERIARRDGQILVGGLGLSYGGAFQLAGALADGRFAAIVPTATWYDLRYSLAPANVVKTVWGASLVALGLPTSGVKLDPVMYAALAQALAAPITGRGISDTVAAQLYANSPIAVFDNEDPDTLDALEADVLLVQGAGDTLFNLNEAVANAKALTAAGRDVHLVVMRHGHSLPFLEDINRIAYETDAHLAIGGKRVQMADVELAWLDWKLRGHNKPGLLPRVAVVLDDDTVLGFDALPEAREPNIAFEGEAITGGMDLLRNTLSRDTLGSVKRLGQKTWDNAKSQIKTWLASDPEARDAHGTGLLARLVNALPAHHLDELASGGTFIELMTVEDTDQALAGIPTLDAEITGGGPRPVVFVGLGIKRPDQPITLLVNDQIRPIRNTGHHQIDMNGVAARLFPGDRLGLMVYGYHPQFLASFSAIPGRLTIAGHVALPLVQVSQYQLN